MKTYSNDTQIVGFLFLFISLFPLFAIANIQNDSIIKPQRRNSSIMITNLKTTEHNSM